MMSLDFTNQRERVETTGVGREAVQDDDVLHAVLRKSGDT